MDEFKEILKILFVEDLQTDMQLAEYHLRKDGLTFTSIRVEDQEALQSALIDFHPDLVISDYAMPVFDGMLALNICLAHNQDLPVIILTGSMNEQTAVSCLKAGAADYVIKEHMMRLPFAVRDALKQSAQKKARKLAEKQLQEKDEELSAIFANSPVLMILVDSGRHIIKVNGQEQEAGQSIHIKNIGQKLGDALKCINSLNSPEGCGSAASCSSCGVRRLILDTFETGESKYQMDASLLVGELHDQKELNLLLSTTRLTIRNQPMVLISILDISEKKKTDQLLFRERTLLRTLIDNLPDRIFFKDRQSRFVIANEGVAKHIGLLATDELIGKSDFDFYPFDHASEYFDSEQELLRSESPLINHDEPSMDATGNLGWTLTSKIPVRDSNGEIMGLVGISRDITHLKRSNEELLKAKNLAERSNLLKDAFIANISHEIRTPLNSILGFTDLVRESFADYQNDETEHYFQIIEQSSHRLMRTVDMILSMSRLQVGEITIQPQSIDLKVLIQKLIQQQSLLAAKKSLALEFFVNCSESSIISDEYCVSHAISNLIDNAIKYTKAGFVRLILDLTEDDKFRLVVKDSGIGISEDYQAFLFDPFTQEEPGISRPFEGIGLGLSLTRRFLDNIGAEITVSSRRGEGSEFTVFFPRSFGRISG